RTRGRPVKSSTSSSTGWRASRIARAPSTARATALACSPTSRARSGRISSPARERMRRPAAAGGSRAGRASSGSAGSPGAGATSVAFGHNRYATNTSTSFTRVQPFAVFAHNGEINTISRLREEARALGLPLSRDGSDSQDVDAVIRGLVIRHRLTPIEAIELLFPPIVNEMKRMSPELQDAYVQARAAFGPLAQGPAAILARVGDTC